MEFEVIRRLYVVGRGHVTVIDNPDELPIDCKCKVECEDGTKIDIIGVERWMNLMTIQRPYRHVGIVTNNATEGEKINITND